MQAGLYRLVCDESGLDLLNCLSPVQLLRKTSCCWDRCNLSCITLKIASPTKELSVAYAIEMHKRSKAAAQMWYDAYDHTKWLESGFRAKNTHRLVPVKTLHTPTTGIISDNGCDLRAYTACGLSVLASPGFKLGGHKGSCWLLPLMRCCQWWAVAFIKAQHSANS